MTEIIIVGCVGGCISALSYKFIQDNLKNEKEKKNNIAEYIRLDFEICEKRKELIKMMFNERKELEQEFIYEYPDISLDARKELSQKIVKIKYEWFDDHKNIIKNMSYKRNNIRLKLNNIDIYEINMQKKKNSI